MQHTKGIILVDIKADIKLRFALMLIVLTMALSGCSQKPNQDEGSVSKDTLSAPLPSTLRALAVDATTRWLKSSSMVVRLKPVPIFRLTRRTAPILVVSHYQLAHIYFH